MVQERHMSGHVEGTLYEKLVFKYSEEKPGTVPDKVSFQETSAKTDL